MGGAYDVHTIHNVPLMVGPKIPRSPISEIMARSKAGEDKPQHVNIRTKSVNLKRVRNMEITECIFNSLFEK